MMKHKNRWDVFISHASEDKATFVGPLANLLVSRFGIQVWYDDFTLELGDSLMRSIDLGLSRSRYGLVVLSKAFMSKRWPEYELRGLTALEQSRKGKRILPIILPIWYGVNQQEVLRFSPSLADKSAIITAQVTLLEAAVRIIRVIRPDIYENLVRTQLYHEIQKATPTYRVNIDQIAVSSPRHETLPPALINRIRIQTSVLDESITGMSFEAAVYLVRCDMHPEQEVEVWEHITSNYLKVMGNQELNLDQKREVYAAVLGATTGNLKPEEFASFKYVTRDMLDKAGVDYTYVEAPMMPDNLDDLQGKVRNSPGPQTYTSRGDSRNGTPSWTPASKRRPLH